MFKSLTNKAIKSAKEVIVKDVENKLPTIISIIGGIIGIISYGVIFKKSKPKEVTIIYNYYITYKGEK